MSTDNITLVTCCVDNLSIIFFCKYSQFIEKSDSSEAPTEDASESEKSGVTMSHPPIKHLNPYNYQMELAKPALPGPDGGKNTIVVAPTGSGKTIVAVKVAKDFLEFKPEAEGAGIGVLKALPKKVVFLVNQVRVLVSCNCQRGCQLTFLVSNYLQVALLI